MTLRHLQRCFVVGLLALSVPAAAPHAQSPASTGRFASAEAQQRLADRAVRSGRIRIIVALNLPVQNEAQLDRAQRGIQRAMIVSAQSALLGGLARFTPQAVARFEVLPGMAMDVDRPTLDYLASNPQVAFIAEDELAAPTLAESAGIIGAPTVWASGYTGAGQTVAILDTGVDRNHPFLGGRVVSEACFSTTSGGQSTSVCPAGNNPGGADLQTGTGAAAPCSFAPDCAHGTHVAGIAAGSGALGGVTMHGVARGANIIAIQVFSRFTGASCGGGTCALSYTSDQIRGMERVYALRDSFSIASANLSLGGNTPYSSQAQCDGENGTRKSIIDSMRAAGIATVIAAGNNGFTNALSAPACISSAISVGSTKEGSFNATPVDTISSFSNSASFLTLLAPGQAITSSVPTLFVAAGYSSYQGTSMAAPQVAGAWALLRSATPSATVTQVLTALATTGRPVTDPRNGVLKRRINVAEAMNALAPPCSYSISPLSVSIAAAGGSTTASVTTTTGCGWTAASASSFITVTHGSNGSGPGAVTMFVDSNNSTSRSGTVTIAGTTFTLTQAAPAGGSETLDFNRDGGFDILWQHQTTGHIAAWLMNGPNQVAGTAFSPGQVADTNWKIVGAGDLDGDGSVDLLWQNLADGRVSAWLMNDLLLREGQIISLPQVPDTRWRIRSVGDLDGDRNVDLIWQHELDGRISAWLMDGLTVREGVLLSPSIVEDTGWVIVAAADFDRDGSRDLLWHHQIDGRIAIWRMDGTTQVRGFLTNPGQVEDTNWKIRGAGDVNGDGYPDILWQNVADGRISVWFMRGADLIAGTLLNPSQVSDLNWKIVGPR